MKQWLKDFVHNCVVHPMMPFLPTGLANALHEVNGYWAFGKPFMVNSNDITYVSVPENQVFNARQLLDIIEKSMAKSADKPSMRDFEEWKRHKLFDEFAEAATNGLPVPVELMPYLSDDKTVIISKRQLDIILKYFQEGFSAISCHGFRLFGLDGMKNIQPTEAEFRSAVIVQLKKLLDAK